MRGMSNSEREQIHNQDQSGQQAWGRSGVAVSLMSTLRATLYTGKQYEKALTVPSPKNPQFLPALWDGHNDGFSCLVNYHKLTYKTLENLTHSYLRDWIAVQAAGAKEGKTGADLRLAAADYHKDDAVQPVHRRLRVRPGQGRRGRCRRSKPASESRNWKRATRNAGSGYGPS